MICSLFWSNNLSWSSKNLLSYFKTTKFWKKQLQHMGENQRKVTKLPVFWKYLQKRTMVWLFCLVNNSPHSPKMTSFNIFVLLKKKKNSKVNWLREKYSAGTYSAILSLKFDSAVLSFPEFVRSVLRFKMKRYQKETANLLLVKIWAHTDRKLA